MNLFRNSSSFFLFLIALLLFVIMAVSSFIVPAWSNLDSQNAIGTYTIGLPPLRRSSCSFDTTIQFIPTFVDSSLAPTPIVTYEEHWSTATAKELAASKSVVHLLGTDRYGQDYFQQSLRSYQGTLMVILLSGLLSLILGGIVSGIILALPPKIERYAYKILGLLVILPLVIVVIFASTLITNQRGVTLVLLFGFSTWPWVAKPLYEIFKELSKKEFLLFHHIRGESFFRQLFFYYLPHSITTIIEVFWVVVGIALMQEIGLSVMGLSSTTTPTLGKLLIAAQNSGAYIDGLWWVFGAPIVLLSTIQLLISLMIYGVRSSERGV